MPPQELSEIEALIDRLSNCEQLRLIEELAHRLRSRSTGSDPAYLSGQLAAMAGDPQVRDELRKIDREFTAAESDGLERS